MESILSDVRYALRFLRRSPAFAFVAVSSLAVGIGINAALFSVVDALLLRPLPVAAPERLVDIYTSGSDGDPYATSSYPDYVDFKAESAVFEDIAGHSAMLATLNLEDRSRLVLGEVVTGNYFRVLGLYASRGRTLLPEDDRPGADRVVMVSHRYWQRELGGDPQVVGRTVRLRGQPYVIVGVAPEGFAGLLAHARGGALAAHGPGRRGAARRHPGLRALARQHPARAPRAEVAVLEGQAEAGGQRGRGPGQSRPRDGSPSGSPIRSPTRTARRPWSPPAGCASIPSADAVLLPVGAAAMGLVGLVLLIACANVASLLLARASARRREIGIRMAIGASRGRVVRQLLAESACSAFSAALAGRGPGRGCGSAPDGRSLARPGAGEPSTCASTLRVLAFTFGVAVLAGLLAGLAPALRASRPNLVTELRGDTAPQDSSGRWLTFRDVLVAGQMAVTFVLLVTAGLVGRSLLVSKRASLGFEPEGIAVVSTDPSMLRYTPERSSGVLRAGGGAHPRAARRAVGSHRVPPALFPQFQRAPVRRAWPRLARRPRLHLEEHLRLLGLLRDPGRAPASGRVSSRPPTPPSRPASRS